MVEIMQLLCSAHRDIWDYEDKIEYDYEFSNQIRVPHFIYHTNLIPGVYCKQQERLINQGMPFRIRTNIPTRFRTCSQIESQDLIFLNMMLTSLNDFIGVSVKLKSRKQLILTNLRDKG